MMDRPSQIVIVEDEESDVTFITKALERGQLEHDITVCSSGPEFFAHLEQRQADGVAPDLVLLDLSLPGMSGLEVLSILRESDVWPLLVVIILTSSGYRREINDAYIGGVNAFVTKPARLADLDGLVAGIEQFWLRSAHRPYVQPLGS